MTKRFRLAEKNKTEPGVVGAWTQGKGGDEPVS